MMRPLRVRTPLRGCRSGCQNAGNPHKHWPAPGAPPAPGTKKLLGGKTRDLPCTPTCTAYTNVYTTVGFFAQIFFCPECPEHPERTSSYAVFSVQLTRSVYFSTRSARSG
jgi:hypothetical protein